MSEENLTQKEMDLKFNMVSMTLNGCNVSEALSILATVQAKVEAYFIKKEKLDEAHKIYLDKVTEHYEIYKEVFDNENRRDETATEA
jgi:ribosomal protein L22